MTTIGPSQRGANAGTPSESKSTQRGADVADLAPAARPAVDNGQYAAPAPTARNAFQRDVLTVMPTVRMPVSTPLAGQEAVRSTAESNRDVGELRGEATAVNGDTGLLSRFATPLRRVLMRENASETLRQVLVEQMPGQQQPQQPMGSIPSPVAMAALLAHLPRLPQTSGYQPRKADSSRHNAQAEEETEEAEAIRKAALSRARVSRRV
jgi:hypothetical protein